MKFNEKLVMLRKTTQFITRTKFQKIRVARQTISKWECEKQPRNGC